MPRAAERYLELTLTAPLQFAAIAKQGTAALVGSGRRPPEGSSNMLIIHGFFNALLNPPLTRDGYFTGTLARIPAHGSKR